MVRKIIKTLLACSLLFPSLGFALGLGDIHLHSALNQQLNAEIDLLSVDPADQDKIHASLASYETFAKIGVDRPSVLMLLSFEVRRRANGASYILVKSKEPIGEPFLDFLVEVNWPSGQLLKEYTLLLDPPDIAQVEAPVVEAPMVEEPAPPVVRTQPATPSPAMPPAKAQEDDIARGEPVEEPVAQQAAAEEPVVPQQEKGTAASAEATPSPESEGAAQAHAAPDYAGAPQQGDTPAPQAGRAVAPSFKKAASSAPKGKKGESKGGEEAVAEGELEYGPVKRDETLSQIARRMRPSEQVTLDQTMVALYNNNREAFIQGNINLLRKGAVLRIDDPASLSEISKAEANRVVARHHHAWQEYRNKVASSTPKAAEPAPAAVEKQPVSSGSAAAVKEEPKLSLVAPQKPAVTKKDNGKEAVAGGTAEQDVTDTLRKDLLRAKESAAAHRKENEELNNRLKELEGQLDSMQKLISLKDDNLAAMQQQLAKNQKESEAPKEPAAQPQPQQGKPQAKLPEPVKPPVAVEPPKVPEAAKPTQPAEPAKTPEPAASTKLAEVAKPVEGATAEPATTAQEAAPATPLPGEDAAAKPKPAKPKAKVVPPPPPPESSLLDDLLANPMLLGGGVAGAIIVVLGLILMMRRRRQSRGFQESILTVGTTSSMMKGKGDNPTSETSFLSDLAISGMGGRVHTAESEVDPLTEADVYMAYNRFPQAEDLLKEGLRHDPEREELHAKLLEVYYKAKNVSAFEQHAQERAATMQQNSAMWKKVVAMGHELAPNNPLFSAGANSSSAALGLGATAAASATPSDVFDIGLDLDALSSEMEEAGSGDLNVDLGLDFSELATQQSAPAPAAQAKADTQAASDMSLDFDLGSFAESQPITTQPLQQEENLLGDLNFDLGSMSEEAPASAEPSASLDMGDFDLGSFNSEPVAEAPAEMSLDMGSFDLGGLEAEPAVESNTASSLDMGDFDLGSFAAETSATEETSSGLDFGNLDFGNMSLDAGPEEPSGFDIGEFGDLGDLGGAGAFEGLDEIGTKLDLAKAYADMGDAEGARSMLEEVIQEGNGEQQQQAKELLAQIA